VHGRRARHRLRRYNDPVLALVTLTCLISLVGTLAYAARIAGVRTRRIAVSLSLFNILLLLSRTANMLQGPLLSKRIERAVLLGGPPDTTDFRWLIGAASLGTVLGALLVPTCQRLFTRAVAGFAVHRSMPRLLWRAFSPAGVAVLRRSLAAPSLAALSSRGPRPPLGVLVSNVLGTAALTVGVLAATYAGALAPALRLTAGSLSSIINGFSTVMLFVVVDPYLSLLTDDVVEGRTEEGFMRRSVIWFLGTRLCGTVLAQLLLVPGALAVVAVAERI
jgi:hypothetical protein